jgi:transcriptional regulator with XRE-family HTH domain
MPFKDRLKALREAAGLSQEGLAREAGLSTSGVAKLERLPMGPSWDTAVKLANALGFSLDAFKDEAPPADKADKPQRGRKAAGGAATAEGGPEKPKGRKQRG